MLQASDKYIVEKDSAIPGLRVMLDSEAFLEQLKEVFLLEPISVKPTYVRYKPNTSCLVRYEMETELGISDVYARAHRKDALEKLEKARLSNLKGESCCVINGKALIVYKYPFDRKLKYLPRLVNEETHHKVLKKSLPNDFLEQNISIQPLVYKPERRFVAKLEGESCTTVLKMYNQESLIKAKLNAEAFSSKDNLRIARNLGHSPKYGTLTFEWLEGRLLRETFSESDFDMSQLHQVGVALANLQSQHSDSLPKRTSKDHVTKLFELGSWFKVVYPELAPRICALVQYISHVLPEISSQFTTVHGDFHSKQVLLRQDTVGIIDLDEAFLGDPAFDLGLFIAHLEYDALRNLFPPLLANLACDTFLEGYKRTTGILPPHIELYAAMGLLSLSPHFFRNRSPNWLEQTELIVARAEQKLTVSASR